MNLSSSPRRMHHVGCGGTLSNIFVLMLSLISILLLSNNFNKSSHFTLVTFTEASTQYLRDIAGGGVCDGIQALQAPVTRPFSAQYNSKGELFILSSNRIRKVDVNGTISTIAGTGIAGYNGDGIDATLAQLNGPFQLLINSRDEIIISDTNNNRIRKILNNGTIITIAGNGNSFPFTENVDATTTSIYYPQGIAVNSHDELFIASYTSELRILFTNGTIATFTKFTKDTYTLAFTNSDNFYLEECYDLEGDCNINLVSANGKVTKLTGDNNRNKGECLHSMDCYIRFGGGMAVSNNGAGDLYYVDTQSIRRLFRNGTIVTICGTDSTSDYNYNDDNIDASLAQIDPFGLSFTPQNELMFTDKSNHRVRKINKFGKVQTIAGRGSGGSSAYNFCGDDILQASSVPLTGPNGVAVNSKGEIIFSDWSNDVGNVIRKISDKGIISTIAGTGSNGFNGDGNATLTNLDGPKGIAITSNDEIIFADSNNHRVRKILTNGTIITIAGTGQTDIVSEPVLSINATLNTPTDVAMTPEGELLIADSLNHRIVKILTNGSLITVAGSKLGIQGTGDDGILSTNSLLNEPRGIAVNGKNEIFIAEYGNNRIRKIFTNGTIITIAGTGSMGKGADNIQATLSQLNSPSKVIVDDEDHVYILDSNNNRVRRILTNGNIITIAGTDSSGYSGNNLPAQSSSLNNPSSIALKPNGDIIVSDTNNKLIRVIFTSVVTCNNTLASDELNVCSGNGKCISFDRCVCNVNYTGKFCQEMVDTNNLDNNSTTIDNSTIVGNNTLITNETIITNNTNLDNLTTNGTINSTNMENSTSIVNTTLIDNSSTTINNTISNNITIIINNSQANNTDIGNNTIVNNNTINNNNSNILNNTNNSTNILNNNTIITQPDQSSQLITDNSNNFRNFNSSNNNYFAFLVFLIIPILVILILIMVIIICIFKRKKRSKDAKPSIVSTDAELVVVNSVV